MPSNPYEFTVKGVTFDFYDFSDSIQFEQSAVEHAVKKLVALGKRSGNKSYSQDLHEAIMSLIRAQEQYNESLRFLSGSTRGTSPVPRYNSDSKPTKIQTTNPHQRPAHVGAGAPTPFSDGASPSIADDPNDIEQAVQFIWRLGYSNQDHGPL